MRSLVIGGTEADNHGVDQIPLISGDLSEVGLDGECWPWWNTIRRLFPEDIGSLFTDGTVGYTEAHDGAGLRSGKAVETNQGSEESDQETADQVVL